MCMLITWCLSWGGRIDTCSKIKAWSYSACILNQIDFRHIWTRLMGILHLYSTLWLIPIIIYATRLEICLSKLGACLHKLLNNLNKFVTPCERHCDVTTSMRRPWQPNTIQNHIWCCHQWEIFHIGQKHVKAMQCGGRRTLVAQGGLSCQKWNFSTLWDRN